MHVISFPNNKSRSGKGYIMIKGSIPALLTPLMNGEVDKKAYQDLIEWQIDQGSHAIVPVGTTGESPTLTHEEHKLVVELAVEASDGRVPVIAGAGSNSTAEAIDFTVHAKEAGADAVLVVAPYYNKPTQDGMYTHFKAVAESTDLPNILYNVPSRTVADILPETVARLANDVANIIGIKDASAQLDRVSKHRAACGNDFIQLSGEDGTALGFNAHGGVGCISVTANVAPALCSQMQQACAAGDYDAALAVQDRLMPLHEAMFVESSPGPVKYAAELLGKCSAETRLPLIPVTESTKTRVRDALIHAGLLN